MSYNLGDKSPEEREKVNVDLAASGVAYKERMNIPVMPAQVKGDQLPSLREYFKPRLHHYRGVPRQFPDPAFYPKDE
ncbi:DNA polymerase-3 subunit theta [Serratia sp. BIGb0234]|uniref:DNA polymerase III subunit theta n=1 Tax=Serratia sp. BIGb0234 TaxID=2940614 RepID=UPI002167E4B2|nr:DNA polymerase III subunit theta [Serratia sp. BIGb0234]MCS4317119.1 DNA polymerase-3 subunit theta [Serratia sp. BIGb0234]